MILWNRELVPQLERRLIVRPGGHDDYRVDDFNLPLLELSPSRTTAWDGRSVLLCGRVYGHWFDPANSAYARWYRSLRRWIESRFTRFSPGGVGTYVGPAAWDWFNRGGLLVPMMATPAATPAWRSYVKGFDTLRRPLVDN